MPDAQNAHGLAGNRSLVLEVAGAKAGYQRDGFVIARGLYGGEEMLEWKRYLTPRQRQRVMKVLSPLPLRSTLPAWPSRRRAGSGRTRSLPAGSVHCVGGLCSAAGPPSEDAQGNHHRFTEEHREPRQRPLHVIRIRHPRRIFDPLERTHVGPEPQPHVAPRKEDEPARGV